MCVSFTCMRDSQEMLQRVIQPYCCSFSLTDISLTVYSSTVISELY